jgi:hypothetical protein
MFIYKRGDGREQLFIIMVDQNLDRATINYRWRSKKLPFGIQALLIKILACNGWIMYQVFG